MDLQNATWTYSPTSLATPSCLRCGCFVTFGEVFNGNACVCECARHVPRRVRPEDRHRLVRLIHEAVRDVRRHEGRVVLRHRIELAIDLTHRLTFENHD